MTIKNYRTIFTEELQSVYDGQEIESFFFIILEKLHQMKRIDLALHPNTVMDGVHLKQWKNTVADLKKQKPIQYILGTTEFYGLLFFVNENTLIPRPETEELVQWIIEDYKERGKEQPGYKILDIGTGSGCIAVALAKNLPDAEVFAVDVSEEALATAKKNAAINGVNVHFIHSDILKLDDIHNLPLSEQPLSFDIIVSNPPYVRNLEKAEIKPNVLEYEPHLALFVDDTDALLFYRKIAQLALKNLTTQGRLYFEINQYLGKETVQLLENTGFHYIQLKKDIYGNDRMIQSLI